MCDWYALCDREPVGTVGHPILGRVPICQRCADKHDLPIHTETLDDHQIVAVGMCACGTKVAEGKEAEHWAAVGVLP